MNGLTSLRAVAFLEGSSLLVLLAVAMPLKYLAGMPGAVRAIGSLHGLFFLMFVVTLFRVAGEQRWPARRAWLALLASMLPLGTFVLDRSLRRDARAPNVVSRRP